MRSRKEWMVGLLALSFFGWVGLGTAQESGNLRKQIDLGGEWQLLPVHGRTPGDAVPALGEPGPDGAQWQTVTFPGLWTDKEHDCAWIVKEVEIAPEDVDKAFVFRFGAAAHVAKLYVNGQLVAEHLGALVPFNPPPVVGLFKAGKNLVALGLANASAYLTEDQFEGKLLVRDKAVPELIANPYTYRPVGGRMNIQRWPTMVGLPFGGELIIAPRVFVDDIFVKTTVASMRLEAQVEVVNTTDQPVHVALHGRTVGAQLIGGAEGKAAGTSFMFNDQILPPGRHVMTIRGNWPEAKLWSPEAPNLYYFIAELSPPKEEQWKEVFDREQVRFGFRDIRVDKARIMLNEAPLFMGGGSWTQYGSAPFKSVEEAREKLAQMARWHQGNCIRTHHTLPDQYFCAAADELGIVISIQDEQGGPVNPHPEFWENNIRHWAEFIRARRNHPSIVLWATDNEGTFTGGMPNMMAPAVPWLIRKIDVAKQVDPTRPVTSSHNWDLRGHNDVFDAGYKNHGFFDNFPSGALKYQSWYFDFAAMWDRVSPIVIDEWGETLGFDLTAQDFDDYAYRPFDFRYAPESRIFWPRLYQAWGSYEGIRLTRLQNTVSMLLNFGDRFSIRTADGGLTGPPDFVFELSHKANRPIVAFPTEWFTSFFAGEKMELPYTVINGANQPFDGRLIWTARLGQAIIEPSENGPWAVAAEGSRVVASGEIPVQLASGARQEVMLTGMLPRVADSTGLEIAVELRRREPLPEDAYIPVFVRAEEWRDRVWKDKQIYSVSPRVDLKGARRFALLGDEASAEVFRKLGASFDRVASVADAVKTTARTVVIAPRMKLDESQWKQLEQFVDKGGKVLALVRGDDLPLKGFRGVPLDDSGWAINAAYARCAEHPVTKGLIYQDLRQWRQGTAEEPWYVASGVAKRPSQGNFRALIDAGYGWEGGDGLCLAPMLEIPAGKGKAIFTQLHLLETWNIEPAAGRLLERALAYLEKDGEPQKSVVAYGFDVTPWFAQVAAETAALDPAKIGAVIVGARDADRLAALVKEKGEALRRYAEAGGTVLVMDVRPETAALASELAGVAIEAKPVPEKTRIVWINWPKGFSDPLLWGVSHYDTCWFKPPWFGWPTTQSLVMDTELACADPKATLLTDPSCLVSVPRGKGRVLVCNILFARGDKDAYAKALAYNLMAQWLTNLGIQMNPPIEATIRPIRNWLALGTFRLPNRLKGGEDSFQLPDEASLRPKAGETMEHRTWKPVRLDIGSGACNNVNPIFGPPDWSLPTWNYYTAYFFTYVDSPKDQEATLCIGVDDWLKVWVNGEPVGPFDLRRYYTPKDAEAKVQLKRGRNAVLVKCSNGLGNWGFTVMFRDAEGLTYSVE